jgi:uncharacterized protein
VKALPQDQWRLLDLQRIDTQLGQLAHKDATLPAAAALATAQEHVSRRSDESTAAQIIVDDLQIEQERADADVEQVRARARHDQELLDAGSINDPKQLQNLQHELTSLARRQSELEDVELEILERLEGAQAAVTVLTQAAAEATARVMELQEQVVSERAVIAAERANAEADRTSTAGTIPAELLSLYEKIRADHGGIGAAALYRGRCEGCRLELPPNEIERLRNAAVDEVVRCEECRCILVRTGESGL